MNKKQEAMVSKLANIMVKIEKPTESMKELTFMDYFNTFGAYFVNTHYATLLPKQKRKHNLVDLCCELAEIPTEFEADENGEESSFSRGKGDNEIFYYRKKYQSIFNDYYDMFWGILESRGYKNVCE